MTSESVLATHSFDLEGKIEGAMARIRAFSDTSTSPIRAGSWCEWCLGAGDEGLVTAIFRVGLRVFRRQLDSVE